MTISVCCYQRTFEGPDGPSIAKARAKLAVTIGEDNILAGRAGFMPPAISHVRSAPAFIFKLNDDGESSYRHGIVGTDDFWEYPETVTVDHVVDAETDFDADSDTDIGALAGAKAGANAGSDPSFPSGPTTTGGPQAPSAGSNTIP